MKEKDILRRIDDGANFYRNLLGWARHMESVDNGTYSYIKPKKGEQGFWFVYDIRLNGFSQKKRQEAIEEIKGKKAPIWVSLEADDELYRELTGKEKVHGQTEFGEQDEVYMALLKEEKPEYPAGEHQIDRVKSGADFAMWSMMTDNILYGGMPLIHPVYHYHLCQSEMLTAYILCVDGAPAAVAAVMSKGRSASLEFVAAVPEMRDRGLEQEICRRAIDDAFAEGANIVTLRAKGNKAAELYGALGFKAYNYLL